MAIVKDNNLVSGLQGMVGKLVFRTVRGKTIVSGRPHPPQYYSERQREHRIRFREASKLARLALHDPQKKQYYTYKARKLNLPNAYTAALTDYLRKPVVSDIQAKGSHGNLSITVSKKDFALASVEITLTNEQGVSVITTPASPKDQHESEWTARPPADFWTFNNTIPKARTWVVAKDHAGNVTRKEVPAQQLLPDSPH